MDDSEFTTPFEQERAAVRRYESPRERKFLYWGLGFICGAVSIALVVVVYDRFGGRPIGAGATRAPAAAIAAPEDKDFPRARKSVEAALDDPKLAVFDAMTVAANGQDKLVCGYVSSKTDANARRTPFIYHTRADVSFVLFNRKEAFVAGPQIVNACFPTYVVPHNALEASRE